MITSKYVRLGSISTITMGTSPSGNTYNSSGNGLPLLNGPTEFGTIHPDCSVYTTDSKREGREGDLIFCVRGSTTGRMNWADKIYSLGRGVCSIRGRSLKETKFIRYCIELNLDALLKVAGGGTFPNLNRTDLENFLIPYPPNRLQATTILSAYDDLIENNTRRIAILEEMAQSLYQEWFVKFRFPGHEKVGMVESEMGLVPEGWAVVPLRNAASLINRGVSPKYDMISKSLVINQKCIRNGRLSLDEARHHSTKFSDEKLVRLGDILLNSTGVGTLGRVTQIYQDIPNCTVDSHVTIVRPNKIVNIDFFGLQLLGLQSHFESLGVGSTGQTELGRENIAQTKFLLPPQKWQDKFGEIVSPMRKNVIQFLMKNANLRQTRDLLLPKLISGEIDVSSWVEEEGEGGGEKVSEVMVEKGVRKQEVAEPIDREGLVRRSLWE